MNTVLVLGEVRQPGAFVLKEQMGIFDVLALAGGTNDSAALERITITRQSEAEVLVQKLILLSCRVPEPAERLNCCQAMLFLYGRELSGSCPWTSRKTRELPPYRSDKTAGSWLQLRSAGQRGRPHSLDPQ